MAARAALRTSMGNLHSPRGTLDLIRFFACLFCLFLCESDRSSCQRGTARSSPHPYAVLYASVVGVSDRV